MRLKDKDSYHTESISTNKKTTRDRRNVETKIGAKQEVDLGAQIASLAVLYWLRVQHFSILHHYLLLLNFKKNQKFREYQIKLDQNDQVIFHFSPPRCFFTSQMNIQFISWLNSFESSQLEVFDNMKQRHQKLVELDDIYVLVYCNTRFFFETETRFFSA